MSTTRWGILGAGRIAGVFAQGLANLPDAELLAVGSRSQGNADAFGARYGVPRRYPSYDELAADPDVDAIYIATPHVLHAPNSLLCLRAGKAVLCEKPFTINAREAETVIAEARERGVFLMEAMWTRCLPHMETLRGLLADGAIGEPRLLNASFGFRTGFDRHSRLFDPALGGGALLDVGVYTISLASMIFGTPRDVGGAATLGETGVDEQAAAVLSYEDGQLAALNFAIRTATPHEAVLCGSEGTIRIEPPWWAPSSVRLSRPGAEDQVFAPAAIGNGYAHEALEVQRCLREGRTESQIMPLDETVSIMRTMDRLRELWGVCYPGEER